MTYGTLKTVTKGLLTGDNQLPSDNAVILGLLGMAYNHIANKCPVMSLMTLDKSEQVLRLGDGAYIVRVPELPLEDADELDIDDDLGYVAASLIASFVSAKKIQIHEMRAERGIDFYNGKVEVLKDSFNFPESTI